MNKNISPPAHEVRAKYTGQLSIHAGHRVGSYSAAVSGRYCRGRSYWGIKEFGLRPAPGPNFFEERTDLGRFKTKRLAAAYLLEIANTQGVWRSSDNVTEYIRIDLKKKA